MRVVPQAGLVAAVLLVAGEACAQDDGPRVYQLVPVGSRTFTAFAVAKRGNEAPEPGSVVRGSEIDTDILVLRYVQTFEFANRPFSPFVILPVGSVKATGAPASSGLGDAQVGATLGLIGSRALSPQQFAAFRPRFGLALLARIYFPTGDYSADKPVNLGANRFAYQIGAPMTFAAGRSYRDPSLLSLEVLPTVTFYGANTAPYRAGRSTKEPLASVEAHLTRNLGARYWVSADVLYRRGGETRTDGLADGNDTRGWSAGASAAFPFPARTTMILSYQHVVERDDEGPDGWFFRAALVAPF